MDEKTFDKLVHAVHDEVCGCGIKDCKTIIEIQNWIYNADNPDAISIDSASDLVHEWNEYSGENL